VKDGIWIVDAFTPVAFRGNAAAVCMFDAFPSDKELQLIAAQMNLSETAFLVNTGPLAYKLRWFTPDVEVKLCGHASLAATHVLHQSGLLKKGELVTYDTLSGKLTARVLDNGIEMDFPALPGTVVKAPAALKALGVDILACEQNRDNYLVEVKDYETLLACAPSFKKLAKLECVGVIVTTNKDVEGFDFASRYFAPAVGVNEDPATGSAHCFLGPYWAKKTGKQQFHAIQASKGRGIIDVTVKGERVLLTGQAVTTLKGHIRTTNPKQQKQKKETVAC
jgi:PhzF family phenazine biosynthesis protein